MQKKNKNDEWDGIINKRKFFSRVGKSFVCVGCGAVKSKANELHKEYATHKLFEWEVIGNKILCARCVCALFRSNAWKN